jgi:hypothetical protein
MYSGSYATPSRFLLGFPLGQGSELLRAVVTGTMGPRHGPVKSDLHAVADKAHADGGPNEAIADAITHGRSRKPPTRRSSLQVIDDSRLC